MTSLHGVGCDVARTPVVVVHGSGADPEDYVNLLSPYARSNNRMMTVPDFRGSGGHRYQRLGGGGRALGAVEVLEEAVAVADDSGAIDSRQFDLIGFSGGAQFVHRFAMLYPARVRRAVVGAAGWYTRLDPGRPFPYGVGVSVDSGGRDVDIDSFLNVPIVVAVGEGDTHRGQGLRISRRIDHEQGQHRLARAVNWVQHLHEQADARNLNSHASLRLLMATGHSFRDAVDRGGFAAMAFDFLGSEVRAPRQPVAVGVMS